MFGISLADLRRRSFVFVAAMLFASMCGAESTWQFIGLTETLRGEPGWQTTNGTATVRMENGRIKIQVFELPSSQSSVSQFKEPILTIDGSVDAKGNIIAIGTRSHSDERPFKLNGTFTTWRREENWSGHIKRVTFRDIIFPLHPHYEMYGFISRTVEDSP